MYSLKQYLIPKVESLVWISAKLIDLFAKPPCNVCIKSLTKKNRKQVERKLINDDESEINLLQMLMIVLCVMILLGMGIRAVVIIIFVEDHEFVAKLIGSIFTMVHVENYLAEMNVLFFTSYGLLLLLTMTVGNKRWMFFKIIVVYCRQVYNPICPHKVQFNYFQFPEPIFEKLQKRVRIYFLTGGFFQYMLPVEIFSTAVLVYTFGDIHASNYFEYKIKLLYYVNAAFVTLMWPTWAFLAYMFMFSNFLIFLNSVSIFSAKNKSIQLKLAMLDFKKKSFYPQYQLSQQINRNVELFDEILEMKTFWKYYLTFTNISCSIWICFALFICLVTNALLFMKVFFLTASSLAVIFLFASTRVSSSVYRKTRETYKCYIQKLCKYPTQISFSRQIKVKYGLQRENLSQLKQVCNLQYFVHLDFDFTRCNIGELSWLHLHKQ